MRKWLPLLFLLTLTLGLPALGAFAGHRLTYLRMRKKPWEVPDQVRQRVEHWRAVETLTGAFALLKIPVEGVERCYYEPTPDLTQVSWSCRCIPTPFVGCAPAPGPLPGGGSINQQQFRYDREVQVRKPKGVCRIFLIGGSTALGTGASSNGTTAGGYLEKYLNQASNQWGCQFEVITAATSAWVTTHERILVENRLVEFEPDVVIALSGHNDAHWSSLDRNTAWFRSYHDDYYYLLANSLLTSNFGQEFPGTDPGVGLPVGEKDMLARLRRNVTLTHTALRDVGADYCFALQPILVGTAKPLTSRETQMREFVNQDGLVPRYASMRKALHKIDRPGWQYWDLTTVFDDCAQDVFIDGCHFGDRGYDLIAQRLLRHLEPVLEKRLERKGVAVR